MEKKPILVVMAAGMGSRYGGLKQLDPVDKNGHIIMDFSVYDAVRAGFGKVVFVIREEHEEAFRDRIIDRMQPYADRHGVVLETAFQMLERLPATPGEDGPWTVPEGRVKPWGTAHAVLCASEHIDAPFAVINADDYYGPEGFRLLAEFLTDDNQTGGRAHYAMVGFELAKTVTDNGYVSRGVCEIDDKGYLVSVTERVRIEKRGGGIAFTEDDGASWQTLDPATRVSMNLWGFTEGFIDEIDRGLARFLTDIMPDNPMKSEYYLPAVVTGMLNAGTADVAVLPTPDQWYGVTYKEDKPQVEAAIAGLKEDGIYPDRLFE